MNHQGVLESYSGQKADLVLIRRLKLAEEVYQNQSYGVLFAIPCKVGGMEFTHQGFIHETRGQFAVFAILGEPRPGRREGTMTPALRLFVLPMQSEDLVQYGSLWQEKAKESDTIYYRGQTKTNPTKWLTAFKAKASVDNEDAPDSIGGAEAEIPSEFGEDLPF
jgi:hypothetical protein